MALILQIGFSTSIVASTQGGRKQIFYGGVTVNSEKRIFKKFPKFTK